MMDEFIWLWLFIRIFALSVISPGPFPEYKLFIAILPSIISWYKLLAPAYLILSILSNAILLNLLQSHHNILFFRRNFPCIRCRRIANWFHLSDNSLSYFLDVFHYFCVQALILRFHMSNIRPVSIQKRKEVLYTFGKTQVVEPVCYIAQDHCERIPLFWWIPAFVLRPSFSLLSGLPSFYFYILCLTKGLIEQKAAAW